MSDIKQCFVSRWGDAGYILEADFSQLEVVGLAILSGDEVLKDDILSGRDMHKVRAAELFSIPESKVSKAQRQIAKAFSFQLQYGAGAKSMAEKNAVSVELAQKFIDNYYSRYAGVKEWQEWVKQQVEDSRVPSGKHTPLGYPQGQGEMHSATGRIYRFFEYDAPAWARSKEPRFSPTEMKNYAVQGFATADVMALYRGLLYRASLHEEDWRAINTVHDSVVFDVKKHKVEELIKLLEDTAAKLPEELYSRWGIKCDMPFKIECKYGPTWGTTS